MSTKFSYGLLGLIYFLAYLTSALYTHGVEDGLKLTIPLMITTIVVIPLCCLFVFLYSIFIKKISRNRLNIIGNILFLILVPLTFVPPLVLAGFDSFTSDMSVALSEIILMVYLLGFKKKLNFKYRDLVFALLIWPIFSLICLSIFVSGTYTIFSVYGKFV